MTKRILFVVLASSLAACGGGGGASNTPITGVQAALVNAECANQVECQGEPDATTCTTISGSGNSDEIATLIGDVNAGIVKYDASALGSCIDELNTNPCEFTGEHNSTDPDCNKVFTGTLAAGANCFVDEECISAVCDNAGSGSDQCDTSTTCCPGTCGSAASAGVAIGGACTDETPCVTTAFCEEGSAQSGTGICTALITTAGAPCDTGGACADPMYCDQEADSPTCKTAAAEGATCSPDDEVPCADERDYCNTTTLKCTANAKVGAACSTSDTATIPCEALADCTNSICVAKPGPGSACTASTDGESPCLGDIPCTGGRCTPVVTTGSDCN